MCLLADSSLTCLSNVFSRVISSNLCNCLVSNTDINKKKQLIEKHLLLIIDHL